MKCLEYVWNKVNMLEMVTAVFIIVTTPLIPRSGSSLALVRHAYASVSLFASSPWSAFMTTIKLRDRAPNEIISSLLGSKWICLQYLFKLSGCD